MEGGRKVEYLSAFDLVTVVMKLFREHVAVMEPHCFVFSFLTILLLYVGGKSEEN